WHVFVLTEVQGVARLQSGAQTHELGDEVVVDVVHDDQAFVRVAHLSGVVDAELPSLAGHGGDVGGVEDDHRVDAAELEHGLLEVLTGLSADDRSGPLGPGQRYTLHAGVGDDRSDLVVAGEQVRVAAVGDTGGTED